MALQVTGIERKFSIKKGKKEEFLPDPDPTMSPSEVIKHYIPIYPELTNAHIDGPDTKDGKLVYSMSTEVGTHG